MNYDTATALSVKKALKDEGSILLYAGDGDESHIITEDVNGMPAKLEKQDLLKFVAQGTNEPWYILMGGVTLRK